jgi:hypothetical protein
MFLFAFFITLKHFDEFVTPQVTPLIEIMGNHIVIRIHSIVLFYHNHNIEERVVFLIIVVIYIYLRYLRTCVRVYL